MITRYKTFFQALLLLAILGCTKPFEIESFDFERVVVVNGLVTDEFKKHDVFLSYTRPIGSQEKDLMTSAEVWIKEVGGAKISYSEIAPGHYQSTTEFAGVSGKQYELHFITSDGEEYRSTSVTLIKSPPIDSIYDQYATVSLEGEAELNSGIQFFIDTHDDNEQAKYFRYEWREDFKIVSPYPSRYVYNEEDSSYSYREIQGHICYDSSVSNQLIIGTSVGSSVNRLVQFPIRFVSGQSDRLRNRYALYVKQYAISESAYGFYRKLKESNESGGSLFDKQQGTITGNVFSIDNPTSTVLGFFDAAGVSEKRTFFSNSDLDRRVGLPPFRYDCSPFTLIETTLDSISFYAGDQGYQIVSANPLDRPAAVLGTLSCTMCDWYATTVKPDFWID